MMKTREILTLCMLIMTSFATASYCQETTGSLSKLSAGIITGYNRGYGIQANFTVRGFAEEFPFEIRSGVGYSFLNPGVSWDARRIFINNATNGVPEKKGRSFDFRVDFLLPASFFGMGHAYIVAGPKFSTFRGNFKFIGGNEDFDVTSHQWGLGGGIENHFRMIGRLSLVLALGLDYYFRSTLTGHDTSYSPDDDNVNPREDIYNDNVYFNYKDADKIIYQPRFMPRAMIGVNVDL